MLELGNIDLATDPLAARYIKTEIVSVEFARSDGELISTEGPNRYRAGDAFVFASRTETQGLVLLEAMALGVPVVALSEMGTRDILDAGRGALVAEHDEKNFADAVCRLLDAPALRARLSREGRAYAAEWSAARQAERLAAFYAEVIAAPRRLSAAGTAGAGHRIHRQSALRP